MKKVLLTAVLAIVWSLPTRAQDTHDTLTEDALKAYSGFADILTTIKDKESAEKAKVELKKTGEKLSALKVRMDKIGEPLGAKKDELEKKYKPKMEEVQKKVQGEMNRILTKVDGGLDIVKDIAATISPTGKP